MTAPCILGVLEMLGICHVICTTSNKTYFMFNTIKPFNRMWREMVLLNTFEVKGTLIVLKIWDNECPFDLESIQKYQLSPHPVEWFVCLKHKNRFVACGAYHIVVIAAGSGLMTSYLITQMTIFISMIVIKLNHQEAKPCLDHPRYDNKN